METRIIINETTALTGFEPEDKSNLVRYLNDPELYRNTLTVPNPYTEADAEKWLATVAEAEQKHGMRVHWAVRHRAMGLIGGIGVFMHTGKEGHRDEIGYWLAGVLRGQGLMTEIVGRFTQHLFETRPLVRVEAWVFAHNPASARVLEKNGYVREGCARKYVKKKDEYFDTILFANIKE
jgi:RimJ/RimL family protein N-acetyltransferase